MKLLLKRALLLPLALLALTPVLALAAHPHGASFYRGPVHVIRAPRYYGSFGLGIGVGLALGYPYYGSYYGSPYYGSPYYGSTYYDGPGNVIVEHNTYVQQPDGNSTPVVTDNSPAPPAASGTSLLRDLQGHCYRRTYAQNGTEQRTELDPSMCNF